MVRGGGRGGSDHIQIRDPSRHRQLILLMSAIGQRVSHIIGPETRLGGHGGGGGCVSGA